MKPEPQACFEALGSFSVRGTDESSIQLASKHAAMEVRVLAPDLYRVRISRGGSLSAQPSWAVVKHDWPAVACRFEASRGKITLATNAGRFSLDPRGGAWRLIDKAGLEVFSAPRRTMGFAGEEARIALRLIEGESLLGLGETTGPWNKRGLIREFWNSDVLGHASAIHPGLRNLYVSIPLLISLREGRAGALFWDNPARQVWDLGSTRTDLFSAFATGGEIDLYLFLSPTLPEIVGRYTELTGRTPMPPLWALGYHQCRYSYETRERVEEVARAFRRKQIPCDALYLDIHHQDGFRVFTFGKTFPRPAEMLRKLARRGFKVVAIVDPGVKDDRRYSVLRRGRKANAFVKGPDGKTDFLGEVWPGKARFPDFLNARVRRWWGREQTRFQELGVAGFWNDMNEPGVFAIPGKTLDLGCVHDSDFGKMPHRSAHNLYGSMMARASREGALACQPDRRPMVITRAGYAGVQRDALVWTGDNSSCWEHMADSLQMLLNLGLSGVAFCGSDVGGFMDNTTGELLARWTQMAAFTPFFRNHSSLGTHDQEPWAFGPEVESICRKYIQLRYQLLPYLYGLFVEAHRSGAPVMRPMAWHYQNDATAVAASDQFMLGPDLLVAPILRQGTTDRSVYLPVGNWFDFWTGKEHRGRHSILAHAGLDVIPLFVRAGTVLPMCAAAGHTGEMTMDLVNLHVWPGAPGELAWYEDDGESCQFVHGAFSERRIIHRREARGGELRFTAAQGGIPSRVKTWRVLLRASHRSFQLRVKGQKIAGSYVPEAALFGFELRNDSAEMVVQWR